MECHGLEYIDPHCISWPHNCIVQRVAIVKVQLRHHFSFSPEVLHAVGANARHQLPSAVPVNAVVPDFILIYSVSAGFLFSYGLRNKHLVIQIVVCTF